MRGGAGSPGISHTHAGWPRPHGSPALGYEGILLCPPAPVTPCLPRGGHLEGTLGLVVLMIPPFEDPALPLPSRPFLAFFLCPLTQRKRKVYTGLKEEDFFVVSMEAPLHYSNVQV